MIYQEILIVIALFIFIVNQANVLYDTFHISFIRHRVIKKMKKSLPMGIENAATDRAKQLTEWPQINWWITIGGIACLVVLGMAMYIFFGYNPNPR